MLQVRAFYRRHNVRVTDWANRPDDHLVLQLRFIAHLMRPGGDAGPDFKAAAQFMDEHILRWIRSQAVRLVQARAPDWYAALSLLTASYLDEVRDYLETITGMARTAPEAKTGKKVELKVIIDPTVLGGLVAQVGDTVIDGSIKTRLQQLKTAF